jgi:uncharacterized membrane protein YhaH (DUF805 family)
MKGLLAVYIVVGGVVVYIIEEMIRYSIQAGNHLCLIFSLILPGCLVFALCAIVVERFRRRRSSKD